MSDFSTYIQRKLNNKALMETEEILQISAKDILSEKTQSWLDQKGETPGHNMMVNFIKANIQKFNSLGHDVSKPPVPVRDGVQDCMANWKDVETYLSPEKNEEDEETPNPFEIKEAVRVVTSIAGSNKVKKDGTKMEDMADDLSQKHQENFSVQKTKAFKTLSANHTSDEAFKDAVLVAADEYGTPAMTAFKYYNQPKKEIPSEEKEEELSPEDKSTIQKILDGEIKSKSKLFGFLRKKNK